MWSDVDFYCERMAAGFGHEPFNAASAVLFVLVGLVMLTQLRGTLERATALCFALVGFGSVALHVSGTMLGYAIDIGANFAFFTAVGVWLLVRLMDVRYWLAVVISTAVVVANTLLALNIVVHVLLGWIIDHYTVLAAVLLLSALATRQDRVLSRGFAASAVVLTGGLYFRFADAGWCADWRFGTHGIWHLFYAASVLILLMTMAAREKRFLQ